LVVVSVGTAIRCRLDPGVGAGHPVEVLSRRNGKNNVDSAPVIGYAVPRIASASIVDGGTTVTDTSDSFPRAVSMLQE